MTRLVTIALRPGEPVADGVERALLPFQRYRVTAAGLRALADYHEQEARGLHRTAVTALASEVAAGLKQTD